MHADEGEPAGVDDATIMMLRTIAAAVSRAGLSDAFGHVSIRSGDALHITRAIPLAEYALDGVPATVQLGSTTLPPGAPLEGWLHLALAENRRDVNAIVRAQPRSVAAFSSLRRDLPALSGHAALLHGIYRHDDSTLVRSRAAAEQIARNAGPACAIILTGNGAVTVGATPADALARMWVLEQTARVALDALSAGTPTPLSPDEYMWWAERADELLPRISRYLIHPILKEEE